MLREALALALCGALCGAAGAAAESPVPAAQLLARLAEERGPIRRHLEESFPSPGAQLVPAHRPSSAQDGASRAQPPAPGPWRRINWGLVLLGLVVGYLALLMAFAANFDA